MMKKKYKFVAWFQTLMEKLVPKKIVTYWKKTAQHDFEAMNAFLKIGRNVEALFYGHIVLEKILKAHVVKQTNIHAPYIHDLVKLERIAELNLSKTEIDFLDDINAFNIRARYPDYKLQIYKNCTKSFAEIRIKKITTIYHKLCETLK